MFQICAAIGMGTGYWFNIQHYYVGLFQRCDNWTQICSSVSKFYDEDNTDKCKVFGYKKICLNCSPISFSLNIITCISFSGNIIYTDKKSI